MYLAAAPRRPLSERAGSLEAIWCALRVRNAEPHNLHIWGKISMDWDDYLREQAAMYRYLAEKAEDALVKQELLDLAATCEEAANNIEDRLTGG